MDDVKQLKAWRRRVLGIRALRDWPRSVRVECNKLLKELDEEIERKGGAK